MGRGNSHHHRWGTHIIIDHRLRGGGGELWLISLRRLAPQHSPARAAAAALGSSRDLCSMATSCTTISMLSATAIIVPWSKADAARRGLRETGEILGTGLQTARAPGRTVVAEYEPLGTVLNSIAIDAARESSQTNSRSHSLFQTAQSLVTRSLGIRYTVSWGFVVRDKNTRAGPVEIRPAG